MKTAMAPHQPNGPTPAQINGVGQLNPPGPPTRLLQPEKKSATARPPSPKPNDYYDFTSSGFSKPQGEFRDYPLVTTKRTLLQGLRYHVARFSSKRNIDPTDQEVFTRPVRLHRRDPRAPPPGSLHGATGQDGEDNMIDDQKRSEEEQKAQRAAIREEQHAQIAPSTKAGSGKKLAPFKKKIEQVYSQTEEKKGLSKIHYEETLPWHLDDFEGKQTWQGAYESSLSQTYAMLVLGADERFRMVPLQRSYKFTPKDLFQTMTIEEVEFRMKQKQKEPRWIMQHKQEEKQKLAEEQSMRGQKKLFVGKVEREGGQGGSAAAYTKQENPEVDDLDFSDGDMFADDEENMNPYNEDEEAKEAEQRIKKDQLQANIFDLKDEKDYEKAERKEKEQRQLERKRGKKIKRKLEKLEKTYGVFDSSDSGDSLFSEDVRLAAHCYDTC